MPVVVGLTGGIASGKSSVSEIWGKAGAAVVDADAEARAVLAPNTIGLWLVRRRFGDGIIGPDGTLDRAALARVVFSDNGARAALNARTHPFIIARMLFRLLWATTVELRSVVVLDTPLLFETRSLLPFCGKTVVVYCREEQQVQRGSARAGVPSEDVRRRMQAQIGIEQKRAWADYVVDNSGERDELEKKAMEVYEKVKPSTVAHLVFCGVISACYVVGGHAIYRILRRCIKPFFNQRI